MPDSRSWDALLDVRGQITLRLESHRKVAEDERVPPGVRVRCAAAVDALGRVRDDMDAILTGLRR